MSGSRCAVSFVSRGLPLLLGFVLLTGCGGGDGGGPTELPGMLDLVADADAFVCSGDWADDNHGAAEFSPRAVGQQNDYTGNQIGRQLYRFVAPSAWAGETVTSATLRLKLHDNFAGFPMDVEVRGIPDAWSEMDVTWNDQPAADTPPIDGATAECCHNVYELDVTVYVNAQLAADDTAISFVLRSADEATIGGLRWWQREGDGYDAGGNVGEAPRLILER